MSNGSENASRKSAPLTEVKEEVNKFYESIVKDFRITEYSRLNKKDTFSHYLEKVIGPDPERRKFWKKYYGTGEKLYQGIRSLSEKQEEYVLNPWSYITDDQWKTIIRFYKDISESCKQRVNPLATGALPGKTASIGKIYELLLFDGKNLLSESDVVHIVPKNNVMGTKTYNVKLRNSPKPLSEDYRDEHSVIQLPLDDVYNMFGKMDAIGHQVKEGEIGLFDLNIVRGARKEKAGKKRTKKEIITLG
jgi:hypothetical protein